MKYKIAICDDSDADRQYVLNMVDRWAASAGHVVHTDTFTSAENFLFPFLFLSGFMCDENLSDQKRTRDAFSPKRSATSPIE